MSVLILYDKRCHLPVFLRNERLFEKFPWQVKVEPFSFSLFSTITLYFKWNETLIYLNGKKVEERMESFFYLSREDSSLEHLIVLCESLFGILGVSTSSRRQGHKECGLNNRFLTEEEIYLASADRLLFIQDNIKNTFKLLKKREIDYLVGVVGGLSVLNALLYYKPKKITFFDCNYFSLNYGRLILELIVHSVEHKDFIRRMYGRSINYFLKKTGADDLSKENQELYLDLPRDVEIDSDTLKLLSPKSRELFKRYFIDKEVEFTHCQELLPCWSLFETVPVTLLNDERLNVNTFFYGSGWLSHKESFLLVRGRLIDAKVDFLLWDATALPLSDLVDISGSGCLFLSNIDAFYPLECRENVCRNLTSVQESGGELIWVSSDCFGGMEKNPHQLALHAIAPYLKGEGIEVTTKLPGGFKELECVTIHFRDYISTQFLTETAILHCLLSEGVSCDMFEDILRCSLSTSKRILILEHQKGSMDWEKECSKSLVSKSYLESFLLKFSVKGVFVDISGKLDDKRNMLCIIDLE